MKYLVTETNKIIDVEEYDVPREYISVEDFHTLVPMLIKDYNNIICRFSALIKTGLIEGTNINIIRIPGPPGLIVDQSTNLYDDWWYDEDVSREYAQILKAEAEAEAPYRNYIFADLGDEVVSALDELGVPSIQFIPGGQILLHADGRFIGAYLLTEAGRPKETPEELCKFIEDALSDIEDDGFWEVGTIYRFRPSFKVETYLKNKYHVDEVLFLWYNGETLTMGFKDKLQTYFVDLLDEPRLVETLERLL